MNRYLIAFERWFSSSRGVYQTAAITAAVIVLEYTHVIHDRGMFEFMAWLTIYSGVTQNILAYSNRRSVDEAKLEEALNRALDEREVALGEEMLALLKEHIKIEAESSPTAPK